MEESTPEGNDLKKLEETIRKWVTQIGADLRTEPDKGVLLNRSARIVNRSVHFLVPSNKTGLDILLRMTLTEEQTEELKTNLKDDFRFGEFLRQLGEALMERGCSYQIEVPASMVLKSFTVIGHLYPFDQGGGLTHKEFTDTLMGVLQASTRGMNRVLDGQGSKGSPNYLGDPGVMFG